MEISNWMKDWRWPDAWLAIFGTALVPVIGVAAADPSHQKLTFLAGVFGLVLFGIGAKKAHYVERDKSLPGSVWVSKWRHGLLQNTFAALGIALVALSVCLLVVWI